MLEPTAVFVLAFIGSAHCIGMCGGFAAAIGATRERVAPLLLRQVVYSAGRIFTYSFLGACAGFVGQYFTGFDGGALVTAQQVFSIVAGVVMVVVGASVFGVFRRRRQRQPGFISGLFAPMFRQLLNARGGIGYFVAGVANGFLPCGFVYAFLAMAAATQDAMRGLILMIAFGLGTVPAMMAIGCGATLLSHTARLRVYRIAAVFIVIAGGATIYRAFPLGQPADCCEDDVPTIAFRGAP